MSVELKEIIQHTLKIRESELINIEQSFNNHCFGTLNECASVFIATGFKDLSVAKPALIDKAGLSDLVEFISELKE